MVLEEQHEKTENFPLSCTKRTPLVSVHGVHHVALGTDGGNGSCLRRETVAKKKSEEAETERWELGKGRRGCSTLKSRDMVSAAWVMYCDVPLSYWVPWVLEKLHLWYCAFGTALDQSLKEPLEISFAIKGYACCCISGAELLLTVGLQSSHRIFWKFIPGQSRQVWRQ